MENKPHEVNKNPYDKVKELYLEEFEKIDWGELNNIARNLKLEMGINTHENVLFTTLIFTSLPHNRFMTVGNPTTFEWENDTINVTQSKGDNPIIIDIDNYLKSGWIDASEEEIRESILVSIIHEFTHLISHKQPVKHHNDSNNFSKPFATTSTGVLKVNHFGQLESKEEFNGRLNEALTEVVASIIQSRYKKKEDKSNLRRLGPYINYVFAFNSLVVALSKEKGITHKDIIEMFISDYLSEKEDFTIVNNEYISNLPISIRKAFLELLREETNQNFNNDLFKEMEIQYQISGKDISAVFDVYHMIDDGE